MDNLIQLIGRLHPLIVHLPIGILMLTIGLHALIWRGKYTAFRGMLAPLWFLSFATSTFASIAGYLLSLDGGYGEAAINTHMWFGIGLVVFSGAMFISLQKKIAVAIQIPGLFFIAFLLFATGHYGGNLTHGEDYLTQPLFAVLGLKAEEAETARPPITNIQQAVVYHDLVAPILEQKCYQCHNESKQKGELRLDTQEALLKGGEHGEVIVPGNAEESALYARLVLPEEHDEHMPPEGKPQLTENEVKVIRWWLSKGEGSFTKKVAEVKKDKQIKTLLAGFSGGTTEKADHNAAPPEIPSVQVSKASPEIIHKLKELKVALTPLTTDHVFLGVNMVNNPDFGDEDVKLLLQISDQLVWLDLSDTKITDKAMPEIGRLKHLTRLSLDNTAITDAGLVHLKNLNALQHLNLYNTNVSDDGIKHLIACKNLRRLHLWQTQVTGEGIAALQKRLGENLRISSGIDLKNN